MIPDFGTMNKMFTVLQSFSIKTSEIILFLATHLSYSFLKLNFQKAE